MCSSCGCRECDILHVVDGTKNKFIVKCVKCGNVYAKEIRSYKLEGKK